MYKLTIYQKKKSTYLKDGKEVAYESEQVISYESENLSSLLDMVSQSERFKPGDTKYEINRVEKE